MKSTPPRRAGGNGPAAILAERACHCRAGVQCLTCTAWRRLWRELQQRTARRRALALRGSAP